MSKTDRRNFIKNSTAAALLGLVNPAQTSLEKEEKQPVLKADDWNAGQIYHLIPTASHERILIKASFKKILNGKPYINIGKEKYFGEKTDSLGYFWSFDMKGLKPATTYNLFLHNGDNTQLSDSWPIKTFPHPDETPQSLRLLIYTCAGGHDGVRDGTTQKKLSPKRDNLLVRGLQYKPDALIAIGDHVYWDQRGNKSTRKGLSDVAKEISGVFDRSQPIIGTKNEDVLKRAVGPQVADLYRTHLRSTPAFFFNDDHDYFENDEGSDYFVSFPPDPFNLNLARTSQQLYYPEFLPDPSRPLGLGGSNAADRPQGVSECYGTLRWGKLAELLMFDCRRYVSLKGPTAEFVHEEAEKWIIERIKDTSVTHTVQIPSTPVGWTAGKWGEWYPDFLNADKQLTDTLTKPHWHRGWNLQHDRLLQAAHEVKSKVPLIISGDLHAIGATCVQQSNTHSFANHPIVSILAGPLGADGWPSTNHRATRPLTPKSLITKDDIEAIEENGFIIADFTPGEIKVQFHRFSPEKEDINKIASLQPFKTLSYSRPT